MAEEKTFSLQDDVFNHLEGWGLIIIILIMAILWSIVK
jgi:hypothetical protein